MTRFYDKLKKNLDRTGTLLCVGLDPDLSRIPSFYSQNCEGIYQFLLDVIAQTQDKCIAYKPNISFFEGLGLDGLKVLEKIVRAIPDYIPVVIDAKRGDIGNTSKMQARYIYDYFGADATTLHPYMGEDSLLPFFDYKDKFNFVLALTSNPSAKQFEMRDLHDSTPLYRFIFEQCIAWHKQFQNVGVVVGGTQEHLKTLRSYSKDLLFLIPGIGAQGGDYNFAREAGANADGLALINVSRAVLYPETSISDAIQSIT